MRVINSFVLCLILLLFGCGRRGEDSYVAQARVRAMQTKTFVGYTSQQVTKEIIAVLQDEGYMIKNVSHDLGLLTAERDTSVEKFSKKFFALVFRGKQARWKKHSLIEMTTNVSETDGKTKARINFLVRVYDNLGRVVDVHQLLEEGPYADFFNRVQKGLFLTNGPKAPTKK